MDIQPETSQPTQPNGIGQITAPTQPNAMDIQPETSQPTQPNSVGHITLPIQPNVVGDDHHDSSAFSFIPFTPPTQLNGMGHIAPPTQLNDIGHIAPPTQLNSIGHTAPPTQPNAVGHIAPPTQPNVVDDHFSFVPIDPKDIEEWEPPAELEPPEESEPPTPPVEDLGTPPHPDEVGIEEYEYYVSSRCKKHLSSLDNDWFSVVRGG
jgi:hypothetical protein